MGGDHAPEAPVLGAASAAKHFGIKIVLVGDAEKIQAILDDRHAEKLDIAIKHAPDSIGMRESAVSSIKTKPQSSVHIAFETLVSGEAQAFYSAGNTGAVLAASVIFSGRIDGVDRPAVAVTLPSRKGELVFLDAGANIACRPRHLMQFALMGAVYAKEILGVEKPRIGLLSNGVEESKGTETLKRAREKIKSLEGIEYIGFVEGDEMMKGSVDVVVTDGFTGNLVLKAIEGIGEFMVDSLAELFQGGALNKLSKAILRAKIASLHNRIDYAHYGGAPLVGVRHAVIVGHGRSSSNAVANGIRLAAQIAAANYSDKAAEAFNARALTSTEEAAV